MGVLVAGLVSMLWLVLISYVGGFLVWTFVFTVPLIFVLLTAGAFGVYWWLGVPIAPSSNASNNSSFSPSGTNKFYTGTSVC